MLLYPAQRHAQHRRRRASQTEDNRGIRAIVITGYVMVWGGGRPKEAVSVSGWVRAVMGEARNGEWFMGCSSLEVLYMTAFAKLGESTRSRGLDPPRSLSKVRRLIGFNQMIWLMLRQNLEKKFTKLNRETLSNSLGLLF